MEKDTLEIVPITAGGQQKRGVKYEAANGEVVNNEGEHNFVAEIEEGIKRSLTVKVCRDNKELLSISKLVNNGAKVACARSDSHT